MNTRLNPMQTVSSAPGGGRPLAGRVTDWWFADGPASRLAIVRILVGLYALWYTSHRWQMLADFSHQDPWLYRPVGMAVMFTRPLPSHLFELILTAMFALNIAFILGWKYRWTGPAYAIALMFVLSYRNSWSMIYHSHNLLALHVLVLGFVPAAAAMSVDAVLDKGWRGMRAWLGRPGSDVALPEEKLDDDGFVVGWRFGMAIKLLCAVVLVAYCVTGVAKLASPLGFGWMMGESLRGQIAADAMRKEVLGDEASPLAFILYNQTWLFTIAGVGTIVLEVLAPLALLHRKLAYVWVVNTYLMHLGIYWVMSITFRYQLAGVMFAPFLPLERTIVWGERAVVALSTNRRSAHRVRPTETAAS